MRLWRLLVIILCLNRQDRVGGNLYGRHREYRGTDLSINIILAPKASQQQGKQDHAGHPTGRGLASVGRGKGRNFAQAPGAFGDAATPRVRMTQTLPLSASELP